MVRYRRIRDYDPKNVFTLIIDVFTLLPINEVYFLWLYSTGSRDSMNMLFVRSVKIKCALRLYRVYQYSNRVQNQAGRNQIFAIFLSHFVTVFLFIHVLASIWYNLSCYKCNKPNWTNYLEEYHIFNSSIKKHWFVISYASIGAAFKQTSRGI